MYKTFCADDEVTAEYKLSVGAVLCLYNNLLSFLFGASPNLINDYSPSQKK